MSQVDSEGRSLAGPVTRRRLLTRGAAAGGLALTVPGFLAACSNDSDRSASVERLTWAVNANPRLDPAHSYDLASALVQSLALEGLVRFDERGRVRPHLASEWRQRGESQLVFKLRSGVRFWSGAPLTAEDVVYCFEQQIDPKVASEFASFFANLGSLKAQGRDQVVIDLKAPDPSFIDMLALSGAYIVEAKYWREHKSSIGGPRGLTMGTGPFRVTAYKPDTSVTLEANRRYWGPRPTQKRIDIRVLAEDSTRRLALQSGEIDGTFDLPLEQSATWERTSGINVSYAPGMGSMFLCANVAAEPWNDIHVRRAVAYAIDREGLIKTILNGHGTPANSIVPPAQWRSLADPDEVRAIYERLPKYDFDPERAKSELAQSRSPDGFEVTVATPTQPVRTVKAMESIGESLGKIGISLRVEAIPQAQWIARVVAHENLGLEVMQYLPDYPDPANYPQVFLNGANAQKNAFNLANYRNARVDKLLAEQGSEPLDSEARIKPLASVLEAAGRDLPYIPVWWEDAVVAVGDGLTYTGLNPLFYFQDWARSVQAST